MNSESGQRLSVEELKRLNQLSTTLVPTTPPDTPTRQDWDDLLAAVNTGSGKRHGALWYNVGRFVYVPLAALLCGVALIAHVAF